MEKTKKVTKRQRYEELKAIPAVAEKPELIEFIDHELELLDRKNASSANGEKKLTATQVVNEKIKEDILEVMSAEPNRLFTVSELIKVVDSCKEFSNQKVSALVRQLVLAEKVKKTEDKRKTYFQIA